MVSVDDPLEMRAAVLRSPEADLAIEDVGIVALGRDDVLVRIAATGLCHTDLSPKLNPGLAPFPIILGHEGAGIVEWVGTDVKSISPGDRVVLSFSSCRRCASCRDGRPYHCFEFFARNLNCSAGSGTSRVEGRDGVQIVNSWFGQSSLAEYSVSKAQNVVPVPSSMPLSKAGPLGCGLMTGAGAVLNTFDMAPGESLAVVGSGAVGLAAVMAASYANAGRILAVDRHASRLRTAEAVGATELIDTSQTPLHDSLHELEDGFDYVLDATGDPALILAALQMARPGGLLGLVGLPRGTIELDPRLLTRGKSITYIVEGEADPQRFIPKLIEAWEDGAFMIEALVEMFAFSDIADALQASASGRVVKPVVEQDLPSTSAIHANSGLNEGGDDH